MKTSPWLQEIGPFKNEGSTIFIKKEGICVVKHCNDDHCYHADHHTNQHQCADKIKYMGNRLSHVWGDIL